MRNLAGMAFCAEHGIPFVCDFSLNAANQWTVDYLRSLRRRARDRLVRFESRSTARSGRRRAAGVAGSGDSSAHADVPHGALRVLRGALAGHEQDQLRPAVRRARGEAARPRRHGASCCTPTSAAAIRSSTPCRKARPKSCRSCSPNGLRDFRIELLENRGDKLRALIALYRDLLAGRVTGKEVWQRLNASNRVGVTRGTLEERRNPLAIL